MTKKIANRGLLAAVAASTLVAIIGALAFASIAAAAPTIGLSADHETAAVGDSVKVSVNVSGSGANAVGGLVGNVTYDEAKLTATACTPAATCNLTAGAGQVSFAVFATEPLNGAVASVTFTVAAAGDKVVGLNITQCTNDIGDPQTGCNGTGVTISDVPAATATATHAATATPSTSPSPTVAVFANTGGNPSDGSSSSALPLALAALGLVTIGGAVWAVARTRRIAG